MKGWAARDKCTMDWYGLSDNEVEHRGNDRLPFSRLVAPDMGNSVPDNTFISLFSFSLVILAYICVLVMHLCPSTLLTDSIGMPLDRQTTVAIVCRAMCHVTFLLMPHILMTVCRILLQDV